MEKRSIPMVFFKKMYLNITWKNKTNKKKKIYAGVPKILIAVTSGWEQMIPDFFFIIF